MYPLSNSMPSTCSTLVSIPLDSSTVMTPSLPTLSMASAIQAPMDSSFPAIDATWAMSSLPTTGIATLCSSSTTKATALSIPRFRNMGFAPAVTLRSPSLTIV
ncbi:MAG: hypothetical protein BWY92_01974 [Firmicutes bacterium ADurb.BinA052]|nr:MAG: hypothetical protein BWY92_01974 [Firmicutes bacterium ADurb.BinA052]